MPIRIYKPTSPGRRISSVSTYEELSGVRPYKKLLRPRKERAGRNITGKITIQHRGSGTKKYYRVIDFKQDKFDQKGKIITIEYDPNRNTRIALVQYPDGEKRYVIIPEGLKVGDSIVSSNKAGETKLGNRMPLEFIPSGMLIFNVELTPGKGGEIARSAGTFIKLMAIDGGFAHIKMPSSEIRKVSKTCLATIERVSNPETRCYTIGKAGKSRMKGRRQQVRGSAMNPVDHPHGGGEGRQPIGLKHPKTPWGLPALGVKTRYRKKWTNKYIIQRRKKK